MFDDANILFVLTRTPSRPLAYRARRREALSRLHLRRLMDSDEMHALLCEHVFRRLSNTSLCTVKLVSKTWSGAACETAKLYRKFSVGGCANSAPTADAICAPISPHPGSGGDDASGVKKQDGASAAAACMLRTARWVADAISRQPALAMMRRNEKKKIGVAATHRNARREAERLLAKHLPNTASLLLLRWRRDDDVDGEESTEEEEGASGEGGAPSTSFLEVWRELCARRRQLKNKHTKRLIVSHGRYLE